MEKFFPAEKIILTGNPVRENVLHIEGKRNEAIEFFKLDAGKKTILVIGGSQGARSINHSLRDGLKKFADKNVQLIWQTGKLFFPDAEKAIADLKYESIKAFDFITKMDLAYAAADLIISRAGASTVSEITLVGKPAVMVPLGSQTGIGCRLNCVGFCLMSCA